jgi:MFS family permease
LASARLGSTGAWQSGILYMTYTASALLGATYIVKQAGAKNSLFLGMLLYCFYVACFWVATLFSKDNIFGQRAAAYTGAAIGGIGAGFLWTAQGAYFGQAAEDHAQRLRQPVETATSSLAGIFAFCYLAEEVLLRLLSSFLLEFHIASWNSIFAIYTAITIFSTAAVSCIHNYPKSGVEQNDNDAGVEGSPSSASAILYKVSAALELLFHDPKMKYMIGLNAVFGFTASFLNSYVNGQVVPVALDDPDSKYVGILSSWISAVAAGMSLVFGRLGSRTGKGPILIFGVLCFFGVVFPFVVQPNAKNYGWPMLVAIYSLHGTGRATFEGTLKATFADYFPQEKEGAFANIILQNGLAGAIGYIRK